MRFVRGMFCSVVSFFLGNKLSRWFGRYRGRASRGPISGMDYYSIIKIEFLIFLLIPFPR